ncbi:helix-turn-helix transcriptional regulator [Umezawaea endophytica]|uniref:Helix-turn-helix transcriptional regulator n=1 Tax=Umezawaea endophytica TaxID=1654476 RepID=A0A9X2VUJ6_9PSEU|nr:helix-turn-helix transcriptional regulator [Umezawaea endophytica]MCS7482914.1 helix-turn-helix transcriptional regulator [Umezawaea endophytica]
MRRPLAENGDGHGEPGRRRTDPVELGDFLRRRREALSPERVGTSHYGRRRTPGLRRDEVAALASMSTNYYERLEQARGPQPSAPVLAAVARALDLTADERDHLYLLAGQTPPVPLLRSPRVDPELVSIMDALVPTTIALLTDDLGGVLRQNRVGVAVFGDFAGRPGRAGNLIWRWFTDERWRDALTPAADQEETARSYVADLRASTSARGRDEPALSLIRDLSAVSAEFAELWDRHEVALLRPTTKTLLHPNGNLDVKCAVVRAREAGQRLLTFQPVPGTGTRSRLLRLGEQRPRGQGRVEVD